MISIGQFNDSGTLINELQIRDQLGDGFALDVAPNTTDFMAISAFIEVNPQTRANVCGERSESEPTQIESICRRFESVSLQRVSTRTLVLSARHKSRQITLVDNRRGISLR